MVPQPYSRELPPAAGTRAALHTQDPVAPLEPQRPNSGKLQAGSETSRSQGTAASVPEMVAAIQGHPFTP